MSEFLRAISDGLGIHSAGFLSEDDKDGVTVDEQQHSGPAT